VQINLIPDASVSSAPAGFTSAVQAAANMYDQDFPGNYTVNITYGWGTFDNQVDPQLTSANISLGGIEGETEVSYATVKGWLTNEATLSDQQTAIASLPASYTALPGDTNTFLVSSAQEKALGVFSGNSSAVDGSIGFGTDLTSYSSEWQGLALCEIGHALGWLTDYYAGAPTILDLFRYSSPGVHEWAGGQPAYFSIDGGTTNLANFATTFDYTLFTNLTNDPFCFPVTSSALNLTSLDIEVLNVLGFSDATPHIAPTVHAVSSVPVAENEPIAAASLIASIVNPSGDSITQYIFKDDGGGTGYFTFNGVPQPDGQWIYPTDSSAIQGSTSVRYVGGTSPGTDTLEVGIYDNTTNSYIDASTTITATTTASPSVITAQTILNDYLGITGTALSLSQATTEAIAIYAGTRTESQYINSLLSQAADTTIPVIAVEGSMYAAVGSSVVITNLVNNFLPGQIAYANQVGLDPVLFACLETALVFAFANGSGNSSFANNYGPSNSSMPATHAGDAAFATAATNSIFGSAQTANTAPAILGYVHFLEGFFTANGIVGVQNPTADQIVIAARAGAWGEGIAIALENNLGLYPGQTMNFLEDAAQGTAIYSASLSSQPTAAPFQGAGIASAVTTASHVQVTGVAAPVDHIVM
jgi:hypothetical protein